MKFIQLLVGFVWIILLPLIPTVVISNYLSSPNWSKLLSGIALPKGTIDKIELSGPYAAYAAFVLVALSVYVNLLKLQSDVSKIVRYRQEDAQKIIGNWNYSESVEQEINNQSFVENFTGSFELWFDRDGKLKAKGRANNTNQQVAYTWETDRIFIEDGRATALYKVDNMINQNGAYDWDGRLTLDWNGNSSSKITSMEGTFDTFGLLRKGKLTISR